MSNDSAAPRPATMVLAEQTQLRIPSNLEWIEPTIEYLKSKAVQCGGCEEARAGRLLLALHEALTNSIVHGNLEVSSKLKEQDGDQFARKLAQRSADPAYATREVHIGFDYNGARCQFALTDQGPGFDWETALAQPEPAPEDLWAVSGRGILMMRTLVDEVEYEAGGRRVLLTLRRACPDQRQHPRWPVHERIQLTPIRSDGSVDWDAAYEAVTQNLSEGGLGLLQSQLTQAERVLIGMDLDGQTVYLPAQVRHCKAVENDMLELGCRFLTADETAGLPEQSLNLDEAIVGLIARLNAPVLVSDERRKHERVSYTERIELRAPGKRVRHAFARDLSRGGISMITTEAFPLAELVLSLPLGAGPMLRVRAHVVRCDLITDGFYDVAAHFVGLASSGEWRAAKSE